MDRNPGAISARRRVLTPHTPTELPLIVRHSLGCRSGSVLDSIAVPGFRVLLLLCAEARQRPGVRFHRATACRFPPFGFEPQERERRSQMVAQIVRELEAEQFKSEVPEFGPGDTVRVHAKVVEGTRERIQVFEGVVIRRRAGGINENFTVRRIASHGIGVERTFLVHSPRIDKIEVTRRGRVRRAKLYYLRGRTGRAARIKEKRT